MGSSVLTLPYSILELQALNPAGSRSWKFQIRLLSPSAAACSKILPHNQLNLSRKRYFYTSWRDFPDLSNVMLEQYLIPFFPLWFLVFLHDAMQNVLYFY